MSRLEQVKAAADVTLKEWYDGLRPKNGGEPARTVIGAGLAVLERFAETFPLLPADYLTSSSQVKGAGGSGIKRVLARFGENRIFTKEGGRTTRGARSVADALVERLNAVPGAGELTAEERREVADALQAHLADRAKAYLDRGRLKVEIAPTKPTSAIVADILAAASRKKIAGPVAQHLVGAKLAIRFPDEEIPNHSYTTADVQLGRPGDFVVGDTAIHVTVAPMAAIFDRLEENVVAGLRALLLVPYAKLEGTRQNAEIHGLAGRAEVSSIESFVGQNGDEMSNFKRDRLRIWIRVLLRMYNKRVAAVETDPGLLIDEPEL